MEALEKMAFISEVLGSGQGCLFLGEGARSGLHTILNEINDELAALRLSLEDERER